MTPSSVLLAAKPDVGHREQEVGIVAGAFRGEVERRAGEIALGYEDSGELRGELGIARMGGRGLAQRLERVVGLAGSLQRRRDHPELLDRGRALARLRVVAGGEVHVHQLFPDLVVVRIQLRRFAQHLDRLWLPALVRQLAGDLLEVVEGAGLVAHLDAGAGRGHAALVVLRIERAEPDLGLQRAAHVALRLAQLDQRVQVRARVGVASLAAEDFGHLHQGVLVIRLQLEDLLVDGGGLRARALVIEAVGNLAVLRDRLVDLAGARVEIAERVGEVPVAGLILDQADVLRDGVGQLTLTDQLLGIPERGSAINRHVGT